MITQRVLTNQAKIDEKELTNRAKQDKIYIKLFNKILNNKMFKIDNRK